MQCEIRNRGARQIADIHLYMMEDGDGRDLIGCGQCEAQEGLHGSRRQEIESLDGPSGPSRIVRVKNLAE